jgi:hypothetical protein
LMKEWLNSVREEDVQTPIDFNLFDTKYSDIENKVTSYGINRLKGTLMTLQIQGDIIDFEHLHERWSMNIYYALSEYIIRDNKMPEFNSTHLIDLTNYMRERSFNKFIKWVIFTRNNV